MRVLVVGASGLVGAAVTARLVEAGCDVIGVGRNITAARRRMPLVTWRRADLAKASVADWIEIASGVDAVVDCAGALQDGPRDDLESVHVDGVAALAKACVTARIRRFVLISAAGLERSASAFSETKLAGEAMLGRFDLDWVVLRPGLVLGPSAYGGSALLRGLAAFPLAIPAVLADRTAQVVAADDVAEAVARAVQPEAPMRVACDLVAPDPTTLGAVLRALRGWLGLPPAPVVSLPLVVGALVARVADALAWLEWRSPLRTATLGQLSAGVVGEADHAPSLLGFQPKTLAELLAERPSSVQERWFARLYFVKPLMLATLALVWISSGLVGLARLEAATAVLTHGGVPRRLALPMTIGGAAVDVILGVLALARPTARWALRGMIVATLAYLVGASLWRPDLWADPLGPLLKAIPIAVLAVATLSVMDER